MTTEASTACERRLYTMAPSVVAAGPVQRLTLAEIMAEIAAAIGLDVTNLRRRFSDVSAVLCALQQRFFEGRLACATERVGGMPPGVARIRESFCAYLDYTLEHAELYAWLQAARLSYPALIDAHARRNQGTMTMMGIELRTLGWPAPREAARLALAMLLETALAEVEVRQPLSSLRERLWHCLDALAMPLAAATPGVGGLP